jgi:DNA-binding NarL/FixJ family response regulator
MVRQGLRALLDREGFDVVGEASTGRQAIQLGKETEPDVILLDIIMPDMDGLHALSALRAALPQTSVIMSTAYARPDFLARAIALGAAGLRELSSQTRPTPVGLDTEATALTPQQLRVLSLIAEGMDNAMIADALSLSKNTIKTHVREIFSRLGVTDRTQAAIWALRNGLVR